MNSGSTDDSGATLKPIRIFVCSSGDMIAERQAALRVIEALNRAAHGAARLEPYLWEENIHRFEGAQSYQGNIPLPAEFDIFLGFLFSRIGSRLTEEEYRRDILTKLANFLGRRASIAEALGQLDQLARQDKTTMLLLTGPSGAGKSSFAQAGLIGNLGAYRLHRRRTEGSLFVADLVRAWRHLAVRPAELGGNPAGGILARLGTLLGATDDFAPLSRELAALPFSAAGDLVPHALTARLRAAVQRGLDAIRPKPALFLLLDQLEDLLAADHASATRRLLALLRALADCPERNIWVVVAIADQWRATLGSAGLVAALEGAERFALPAPREGELREIIEVPARRAGLVFESQHDEPLNQVILDDLQALSLHAEAPLPLLQVALEQLENRKDGNLLTFAAYRDMGGFAGAIRSHARNALADWITEERRPVLDRLLFRLVQRDSQQRIVCRLAPRAELEADPEMRALEEHLVAARWRLLQGHEAPDAAAAVRIAHDVLLDQVDAFRAFVETERDNVILLADAQDDAARWVATQGRPATLLNHHLPSVIHLEHLLARLHIPADDDLSVFVGASRAEIERLQCERDAALLTRSRFLAEFARQQNELSDFGTALALGLEAITDPSGAIGSVVASEAVVELDRAVRSLREKRLLHGHEHSVWSAVFDPPGTRVLSASYDGTARLWDAVSGTELAVLRGHEDGVMSAVFDRSGARVLSASDDSTARLWDAASGDELAALRGHVSGVSSAVFDPSGARVLTASVDGTARLWDAASGAELAVLRGHDDRIMRAVFDPPGARVLTASYDGTARLWDAASGAELAVLRGHEDGVMSAVFDPSGAHVLTASADNTARLWDADTGAALAVLRGHENEIWRAEFDGSGARVLTGSLDQTARLWDATSGAELIVLRGHEGLLWSAVFDRSGARVLTASDDGTARLWEAASGAELAVLRGHEHTVLSAVFDQSGARVLTASSDNTARLWDTATGAEFVALRGHKNWVRSAVFDPSAARALTVSDDRTARLWDAATGAELAVLRGHEDGVMSAVFHPFRARVLTASSDQTARLWDAATGTELRVLRGHQDWVRSAVFSRSGARVLTASDDRTARLWDAATGAELAVLRGHQGFVLSAVFHPFFRERVLTASSDRTARLWDAVTGTELAVLRGHEDGVMSAVFDRSGARVLTASADQTAWLWDAMTGAKLTVLRGHERRVMSAVFDPSGARVLTASRDGTARIWPVFPTVAALVGHARTIRPRALTSEQRKQFFLE